MIHPRLGVWVSVVSAGRPQNVAQMQTLIGTRATWYVPRAQFDAYRREGVTALEDQETHGLARARTIAMQDAHAHGQINVQVSDDLRSLKWAVRRGDKVVGEPTTWVAAITALRAALDSTGATLAGVPPTANPFYVNPDAPIRRNVFVIADIMVIPPTTLTFDQGCVPKEDYDFTLAQIAHGGGTVRDDRVLAQFAHYTNKGGLTGIRTDAMEASAVARLKAKWPGALRDNPRRPNEVLINRGWSYGEATR